MTAPLDLEGLRYHACSSGTPTPPMVRDQILAACAEIDRLRSELKLATEQPMQPVYLDKHPDTAPLARFRGNEIVEWMLEEGRNGKRFDLNRIASRFMREEHVRDRMQLVQLIGYSISGYNELSFVSDASAARANAAAHALGVAAPGCRERGCPVHGGGK